MNWKKLTLLPALALSLAIWGCDTLGEVTQPVVDVAAGPAYSDGTTTAVKVKALKGLTDEKERKKSVVIGHEGGSVGIAGNVLIVPKGAVSEPTLFEMKLASVDSLGFTKNQVDLRAYIKNSKGEYKIDVGANGFLKPVKLRLTYDWITDHYTVEGLRIAWVKDAEGNSQIYTTTVDPSGRTVSAFLDHFSDYALAYP